MRDVREEITAAQLRGDPRALVELLERLPPEEKRSRSAAVRGLARLALEGRDMRPSTERDQPLDEVQAVTYGDALRVLGAIVADAREHESVRWYAADALGEHGDDSVVPVLAGMLRDPSKHLRKRAANAMRDLGLSAAEPELLTALDDAERDVRAAVARALGAVGGHRAVAALAERAASDEKVFVRQEALTSLRRLGTADALRAIDDALAAASGLTRWRLRRWLERES